nr:Zygote arrest protein [Ipomoea batatas]
MAEEPRMSADDLPKKKKTLQIADICLDPPVKSKPPQLSSSTPSSPRRLRENSAVKFSCLCSPTTHPGSFRCRHHRNQMRTSMSVGAKLSEMAAGK